ncbi:fungal pheromone STE3G-protein-coupled receptor [Heliocybe sulcata]|uniref:Fungal pheromone STE3G-protein-coupled receptor n=1 Tax=Heliocybe sulcata TaxID=5364 RepID=A0A5C3N0N7_9AGAM|nr:fungal pheromone STE3G-protein-coupled receptor [Heliocybe sulcata]
MGDIPYPLYPVFALLGFILVLIPLPWHVRSWNSGTCWYMLWTGLGCAVHFVNSVLWHGSVSNMAPVWCDISTRIDVAASFGIPAASLCIQRRLYQIVYTKSVSTDASMRRRSVTIDSIICLVLPMVYVGLYYVVEARRFDIFEDIGCLPVFYNSIPTIFLIYIWPLLLALISVVYCALSLKALIKRQIELGTLFSSDTILSRNRYYRFMALSCTELAFSSAIALYVIYVNACTVSLEPWVSWRDTHYNISRVEHIPSIIWRENIHTVVSVEMDRWVFVGCALAFFLFFGLSEEAMLNYSKIVERVMHGLLPSMLTVR